MPAARCCSGVRATSAASPVTAPLIQYGMPHAEYDVARPRSNMTTSRSGRRFLACDAALPPAASPPMTTTRLPTGCTLGHRAAGVLGGVVTGGLPDDPAPMTALGTSTPVDETSRASRKVDTATYERELARLQIELVKQQEYVRARGLRVVVVFEGRDAAGKGGAIQRITESLNPRAAHVVALPAPTEREKGQWYFQRYVAHLPTAGEMVLLDRSWYNRAGVERVMGFCTDEEYAEFLRSCPEFERMLVRSGIILVKYWFSVSDTEQERRFQSRLEDPTKRWKLSPMDLEARNRWVDFSRAKDAMFAGTDIPEAPWWVVEADVKKRARLNVISHLLGQVPYEDLTPEAPVLPPRPPVDEDYVRPPKESQHVVPDVLP